MKKLLLGLVPLIAPACTDQKPNILILFADDQRADALGCAGNPYLKTPNIDSLAGNGVRFANAYVMGGHHGAISAPSRAMLMSGKYLFNVYDKLDGVRTMPMHFADNGYLTFGTGKWHNGGNTFEASFQKGKSVFLGGMNNHYSVICRDLDSTGKLTEPENRGFSTDVFADAAIDFLNDYSETSREKPFFCYVAFTVPHDPYSPAPGYIDKYPGNSLPLPGNWLPLHPFQFDDLTVRDENLLPWPRPPDKVRQVLADYYGLISHLDSRIGDIVKVLKDKGLYDNTIIVYAADNGLAIGSHGLLGKQNLYEHSMRVPLIISGPGIKGDRVSDAFVYLLDIFPTLADLCKLEAPVDIDGQSLSGIISGSSSEVRNSVFTAYRNTIRAVRSGDWKLIRYPERHYDQLFNLKSDPLELNNLAERADTRGKLAELKELMINWQKETNDTARLTSPKQLPLLYDHTTLKRKPDQWQPEYTIEKYFLNN
jgi:arylsulfatase A-like enzyme